VVEGFRRSDVARRWMSATEEQQARAKATSQMSTRFTDHVRSQMRVRMPAPTQSTDVIAHVVTTNQARKFWDPDTF
jgi:hypothetical protein